MLEVEGVVKRFGGLLAVNDLSFQVPAGTILGLIGINGAGKTTVMNCINGIYRSDAGRVRFEDADITNRTPHEIARAGIGRTFQVPRVFRRMTLVENLLVPMLASAESDQALTAQAEAYLAQVDLHGLRHNFAEEPLGRSRRLLEFARVMMFDPKLILLTRLRRRQSAALPSVHRAGGGAAGGRQDLRPGEPRPYLDLSPLRPYRGVEPGPEDRGRRGGSDPPRSRGHRGLSWKG